MKIAICDDSEEIRLEIAELIKEQCPEAAIYHFSSGEVIIGSPNEYDIIFLDIAMGGISGLEAAELLRERQEKSGGKKSIIIFVTAFKEHMPEAFDVNAFHYLIKPPDREKLARVLERALKEANFAESTECIVIKSFGKQRKLFLHDIYYIESSNKKTVYHTKNGIYEAYGKMEELEAKLSGSFYRCHRCFLVNLENVSSYGYDEIRTVNGERLILAKKKYPDFVKAYLRYAKGGGIVNV